MGIQMAVYSPMCPHQRGSNAEDRGGVMPKITVYLPDDLATDVKAAGISVSPICQRALEEEVKRMTLLRTWSGDERLAAARERPLATTAHEELDPARAPG